MKISMNKLLTIFMVFTLFGCLPTEESRVKREVSAEENRKIKPREIRSDLLLEPKPYTPYKIEGEIDDPFAIRNFVINTTEDENVEDDCVDDECKVEGEPPIPHDKQILENYDVDSLALVGTLMKKDGLSTALIKTPDLGVIPAIVGNYLGKDNGLIISITNNRIEVREKVREGNIWRDKRRTMIVE